MKVAVLFSGGKDSCLALHLAKQEGHEICYLLGLIPKNFDSFMFHKPYLSLLKKQAEMLGLKHKLIIQKSLGEKDNELEDLKKLINNVKSKVDGIVAGGIASNYQGSRIKKICNELGLKSYTPLWDYSSERVWDELLKNNFKVILTKISCEGLGKEWLGKTINKKKFEELKEKGEKFGFRIDFEGGEAESAVLFMPEFSKDIKIKFDIKSEGKYRHFLENLKIK